MNNTNAIMKASAPIDSPPTVTCRLESLRDVLNDVDANLRTINARLRGAEVSSGIGTSISEPNGCVMAMLDDALETARNVHKASCEAMSWL